jgi:quercetin dioxygenase-like cupin family protein
MALPNAISGVFTWPDGSKQPFTGYSFLRAGDEIPLHTHSFFQHGTFIVAGSFLVYDDVGKEVRVEAGQFVEFLRGRKHAIKAITDNAYCVNINEPTKRLVSSEAV